MEFVEAIDSVRVMPGSLRIMTDAMLSRVGMPSADANKVAGIWSRWTCLASSAMGHGVCINTSPVFRPRA